MLYDPNPRVHLNTPQAAPQKPIAALNPTQLIVASENADSSIAELVKARRRTPLTMGSTDPSRSIAEWIAHWHCVMANPVLDDETGNLLEYRALIQHPNFKNAWNLSASNVFD